MSERSLVKIKVLPTDLIHRIAAGEVVDRPASALKELIENSIDAHATAIRVQVVEGGLRRLEVEDNGDGFGQDNLEVAVQRHATSKISTLEDLDQIFTLGFRGEALSAIASVSKLSIESRRQGEGACLLQVVGGAKKEIIPGHRKQGTKITVDDLFFNVPARLKFLKRPSSEAQECESVLEKLALSHPEVSFEWFIVDAKGELKQQVTLAATDFLTRFKDITQVKADAKLIKADTLPTGFHDFKVCFFPPPVGAGNQKKIYLTVNGRSLVDKRLPYALREAFTGLIEVGQYPVAHVICEVDPEKIDVNIHPQKKEIRWPDDVSLAGMVYRLVRPQFELKTNSQIDTLASQMGFQDVLQMPLQSETQSLRPILEVKPSQSHSLESAVFEKEMSSLIQNPQVSSVSPSRVTHSLKFSSLKVVGEVGASWIVCESPEGMILIDQHAAHERINFEKFAKDKDLWLAKPLLIPVELKIPYFLQAKIPEISRSLEELGFEISDENFEQKIMILAVPTPVRSLDWERMLEKLFSRLDEDRSLESLFTDLRYELASSLACHGSVRRGQRLGQEQISELLKQMDEVDWGGFCPHGRPVWFLLSHEKIESLFHR